MYQIDVVYKYILKKYKENEPIFISDLSIKGMKDVLVRQNVKKLVNDGRLVKFDTGIYYLPLSVSIFPKDLTLSFDDVIRKKYLYDGEKRCGFIGGISFANQVGITTQLPAVYEIYSNKATTDCRIVHIRGMKIILRKPCVKITDNNVYVIQFLNLIKEVKQVSEVDGKELLNKLKSYMKYRNIDFESLDRYLKYYPDKIYKNMYEVKLINGLSA